MNQQITLDLFPDEKKKKRTPLVFGGIYREQGDPGYYDGSYAVCFGGDAFCFLFDGINHIKSEVELACAHRMELIEGYGLAVKKTGKYVVTHLRKAQRLRKKLSSHYFTTWEIRNSGIKNQPGYILQKGRCGRNFHDSLKPYLKLIHK